MDKWNNGLANSIFWHKKQNNIWYSEPLWVSDILQIRWQPANQIPSIVNKGSEREIQAKH